MSRYVVIGVGLLGFVVVCVLQKCGIVVDGYEVLYGVGGFWDIINLCSMMYEFVYLIFLCMIIEFVEFLMCMWVDYFGYCVLKYYFQDYVEYFGLIVLFWFDIVVVWFELCDDGWGFISVGFGGEEVCWYVGVVLVNGMFVKLNMFVFYGEFFGELLYMSGYMFFEQFCG